MNLKAGQTPLPRKTPIADRIAARMAAAGGDRLFAPNAAYRAHGFDVAGWVEDINHYLRGYEIRPWLPKTRGPDSYALSYLPRFGSAMRLRDAIDPRSMNAPDVYEIIRRHERTLERPPLAPLPQVVERLARLRAEQASAPGMGR